MKINYEAATRMLFITLVLQMLKVLKIYTGIREAAKKVPPPGH